MKKLRIAVIGVGRLGKEHVRIYSRLPDVDLIGVVDINVQHAERIARQYGTKVYELETVIDKIDAASIVVPTDKHFEVAKKLLEAGKDILIEKPITSTIIQGRRLVNLASRKKLILQVGHIERFNPIIQSLVKLVKEPRFIEIHRLSPFTIRGTEVGVVLDLMIHDIDIILDLVKDKIKRIEAVGVNVLTSHEDIANARIVFKNGCVANLTCSRISPERMRKIRVFQEDTYISLDYYKQEGKCFYKKGGQIFEEKLEEGREEPLKLELEAFVECVLKDKKPLVSGEDALKSLQVARKVTKSIWK